jgi:hypothetical protein
MTEEELVKIIDEAFRNFKGVSTELEMAIGALMIGRHIGWKPMLLIHDKKSLRKYEKILGVEFRQVLPEVGEHAEKSLAWQAVQKVTNFWKAVSGNIPNIRSNKIT